MRVDDGKNDLGKRLFVILIYLSREIHTRADQSPEPLPRSFMLIRERKPRCCRLMVCDLESTRSMAVVSMTSRT